MTSLRFIPKTSMATGRELQRAMIEGSWYPHECKAGHLDDYTRRIVHRAWERLGGVPESWMRAGGAAIDNHAPEVHRVRHKGRPDAATFDEFPAPGSVLAQGPESDQPCGPSRSGERRAA